MNREDKIEILPPDPDWQPPQPDRAVVYEVEPQPPGVVSDVKEAKARAQPASFRDAKSGAAVVGDPRVVARLFKLSVRLALIVGAVVFLVWALKPFGPETLPVIVEWLRSQPVVGRVLVVVAVAAGVPFFVPVGPLALVPGYLWGVGEGIGLTLIGATLGGLVNFHLSRRYLGPDVLAWARTNPLASTLYETINRRGLRVIFGMRLSPLMPFGLLCYLSGLVSVPWWGFAVAVTVGGTPWTSVYAIAGSLWAASSQPIDMTSGPDDPWTKGLMWFGLCVTVVLAVWIGRVARRDMLAARAGARTV